ncbi:MAG: glycogen debranching enzyme N-terminal domain-containing protein [Planctomycetes bacterium]|nr:glycogen debranching enzyme N-terminal domain-containing protein [Planctomycetota bacterium]
MPSFISFDKNTCTNLSLAAEKEWLEINGIGGYASSTITGANTRRYHGLLMAATKPPLGRILMLSKLEESLSVGEALFPLSTNFYPNAIYPEGYKNLVRFDLTPVPTFTYSIRDITIEKSVFMVYGENTTVIRYRISMAGTAATPLFLKARG